MHDIACSLNYLALRKMFDKNSPPDAAQEDMKELANVLNRLFGIIFVVGEIIFTVVIFGQIYLAGVEQRKEQD